MLRVFPLKSGCCVDSTSIYRYTAVKTDRIRQEKKIVASKMRKEEVQRPLFAENAIVPLYSPRASPEELLRWENSGILQGTKLTEK